MATRAARSEAALTQDQLALVSGVGRDTVMALENRRPGVSLGAALRVMRGLGLTIAPVRVPDPSAVFPGKFDVPATRLSAE